MQNRSKIGVWIQAARPRTLVISLCPVILGTLLAVAEGTWDFTLFLFTLLTACAIQIGTNLANDYFDFVRGADTSARKGPQRVTQAGLVTPRAMKRAFLGVFTLVALLGSYLVWVGGPIFAWLIALSILLGILYTAGPFSLAYLGIADLFVFLFFGPLATSLTYMLQAGSFSVEAFWAGVGPGGFAWATLILNNLRDIDEDRLAGKKTLCVRGGKGVGRALYLIALATPFLTPWIWIKEHPWALASLLILPLALRVVIHVYRSEGRALAPYFQQTPLLLCLYTLLFSLGWLI